MEIIEKLQAIDTVVDNIFKALTEPGLVESARMNLYIEKKENITGIKSTLTELILTAGDNENTAVEPLAKSILSKVNTKLTEFGNKYLGLKPHTEPIKEVEDVPVKEATLEFVVEPNTEKSQTRNVYMMEQEGSYIPLTLTEEELIQYLNVNFSNIDCPRVFLAEKVNFEIVSVSSYKIINSEVK